MLRGNQAGWSVLALVLLITAALGAAAAAAGPREELYGRAGGNDPNASLQVNPRPTNGTITGPNNLNCGTACIVQVAKLATYQVRATGAPGYALDSWGGACTNKPNPCDLTYTINTANHFVSATFRPARVTVAMPEGGEIRSNLSSPGGIDCGYAGRSVGTMTDCTATFAGQSSVTLTAFEKVGFKLERWQGCTSSSGLTCTLTLDSDKNVSAVFTNVGTVRVSATAPPAGAGKISSTGGMTSFSITCEPFGSFCSAETTRGSTVSLLAEAWAGFRFAGWTGDCSGTAATCTIVADGDRHVGGNWEDLRPTFTVTKPQLGTVRGKVVGETGYSIMCGGYYTDSYCIRKVPAGTRIMMEVESANPGYVFTGFGGCGASGCTVMVNRDLTITANFRRE